MATLHAYLESLPPDHTAGLVMLGAFGVAFLAMLAGFGMAHAADVAAAKSWGR